MPARAPLDVDLEDRLIYGLTPTRFGYLVIAGLAVMAICAQRWLPGVLRAAGSLPVLAAGIGLAWVRWRGRALDSWLGDIAVFLVRNYTVDVSERWRPGRWLAGRQPPWRWRTGSRERSAGREQDRLEVCSSPGLDRP